MLDTQAGLDGPNGQIKAELQLTIFEAGTATGFCSFWDQGFTEMNKD